MPSPHWEPACQSQKEAQVGSGNTTRHNVVSDHLYRRPATQPVEMVPYAQPGACALTVPDREDENAVRMLHC